MEIQHENILELKHYQFDDESLSTEVFFDYPDEMLELKNLDAKSAM